MKPRAVLTEAGLEKFQAEGLSSADLLNVELLVQKDELSPALAELQRRVHETRLVFMKASVDSDEAWKRYSEALAAYDAARRFPEAVTVEMD